MGLSNKEAADDGFHEIYGIVLDAIGSFHDARGAELSMKQSALRRKLHTALLAMCNKVNPPEPISAREPVNGKERTK